MDTRTTQVPYKKTLVSYDPGPESSATLAQRAARKALQHRQALARNKQLPHKYFFEKNVAVLFWGASDQNSTMRGSAEAMSESQADHSETLVLEQLLKNQPDPKNNNKLLQRQGSESAQAFIKRNIETLKKHSVIIFTERPPCEEGDESRIACDKFLQDLKDLGVNLEVYHVIPLDEKTKKRYASNYESATLAVLLPTAFQRMDSQKAQTPKKTETCIMADITRVQGMKAGSTKPGKITFLVRLGDYAKKYNIDIECFKKEIKSVVSFEEKSQIENVADNNNNNDNKKALINQSQPEQLVDTETKKNKNKHRKEGSQVRPSIDNKDKEQITKPLTKEPLKQEISSAQVQLSALHGQQQRTEQLTASQTTKVPPAFIRKKLPPLGHGNGIYFAYDSSLSKYKPLPFGHGNSINEAEKSNSSLTPKIPPRKK